MPKIEKKYISGGLFFSVLISLALYFIFKYPWLLALMAILIPGGIIASRLEKERIAELLDARKEDSICTFARSFDKRKVDPWIIRAVYEEIQDYVSGQGPKIPIHPSDKMIEDLKIDGDDLDDLLNHVLKRCGRTFENYKKNPHYKNLTTVSDMVLFFNEQPLNRNK